MTGEPVKPFPLILDAIDVGDTQKLDQLFIEFPEMLDFRLPAFGTWLHHAAAHDTLEMVEYFVGRGFDINSKENGFGDTPLHNAARKGRPKIVQYLLDQGAELDVSTAIANPIFGAIVGHKEGGIECARLLIDAGIDVDASYVLQGDVKVDSDAIAHAMLHGQTEIAHMVALKKTGGDEAKAQALMAEGRRIAQLRTSD